MADSALSGASSGAIADSFLKSVHLQPMLVAGNPNGTPPDSPDQRVDPNTKTSPYGGVGSIGISLAGVGDFLGTGTAISRRHILTAAHLIDVVNDDGVIDVQPQNVTFNLNFGRIFSQRIKAESLHIFPGYQGFDESTGDDLAILTLSEDLPADLPIYTLNRNPLALGTVITLVGYGTSGNGIDGYTEFSSSFDQKRVGQNQVDREEDGAFLFDFDGATSATNLLALYGSGGSLGNAIETTLGPGDSGGPSFIQQNGQLLLAGVNTFSFSNPLFLGFPGEVSGKFGTGAGGVVISRPDKLTWIDNILASDLLPNLTITAALPQTEGNTGNTVFSFEVKLSAASSQIVTVDYATSDGTAIANSDYLATSGTLTFAPGELSKTIAVSVVGDATVETDETFQVSLSQAQNAAIANPQATGTIQNDDVATPEPPEPPTYNVIEGTSGDDVLGGTAQPDQIWGRAGDDVLVGLGGDDDLNGGVGSDVVRAGLGNDVLRGNGGADFLIGGEGDDVLVGGLGGDRMTGGLGGDRFYYTSPLEAGDTIADFDATVDVIDLKALFNSAVYSHPDRFNAYVRLMQVGANTAVRVDADGDLTSSGFLTLVTLENVSANSLTAAAFQVA